MLLRFFRKRLLPWLFWSVLFLLGASAWATSGSVGPFGPNPPFAATPLILLSEDAVVDIELPHTVDDLTVIVKDEKGNPLAVRYWKGGTKQKVTRVPTRGWKPGTYSVHINARYRHQVRMIVVQE
ncbi:MAG: hypothetical protein AAFV07_19860 [Bacteroidota bacterium]